MVQIFSSQRTEYWPDCILLSISEYLDIVSSVSLWEQSDQIPKLFWNTDVPDALADYTIDRRNAAISLPGGVCLRVHWDVWIIVLSRFLSSLTLFQCTTKWRWYHNIEGHMDPCRASSLQPDQCHGAHNLWAADDIADEPSHASQLAHRHR